MVAAADGGNGDAAASHPDFRRILESIGEYAIFVMNPKGTITTWNVGVEEIFGYSRDDFIGRSGEIIFSPEDRQEGAPEWEMETARSEGKVADNRWHVRQDGSRLWANGMMMSLFDDRSELAGFIKIVRDNTEQKEAELALRNAHAELERRVEERTAELQLALEELRKSEGLFSSIFRVGPFAATVIDRSGKIRDVNEAYCRLAGYGPKEAIGQHIGDVVPEGLPAAGGSQEQLGGSSGAPLQGGGDLPDGSSLESDPGQDVVRTRGEFAWEAPNAFRDRELKLLTSSGEERIVLASGVGLPFDGERRRVVMFFDITERKRSEEELMAAIQDVMQDASWFSRSVVERLAEIRAGSVDTSRVGELTRRERQVLEHVAMGKNNAQIAAELGIASQTVRNYITAVYEKIGVRSRVEAVVWARERGLGL